MEIRPSIEDVLFFKHIERAAAQAGCYARIKRASSWQVRFELMQDEHSPKNASVDQHDQVIARLFMADPGAIVRTARAIYEGAADFEAQKKARVGA